MRLALSLLAIAAGIATVGGIVWLRWRLWLDPVYRDDDEAADIWLKEMGADGESRWLCGVSCEKSGDLSSSAA